MKCGYCKTEGHNTKNCDKLRTLLFNRIHMLMELNAGIKYLRNQHADRQNSDLFSMLQSMSSMDYIKGGPAGKVRAAFRVHITNKTPDMDQTECNVCFNDEVSDWVRYDHCRHYNCVECVSKIMPSGRSHKFSHTKAATNYKESFCDITCPICRQVSRTITMFHPTLDSGKDFV